MSECENCGESVDSRWKFCLNCGTRMPVRAAAPVTPTAAAPSRSYQQVPVYQDSSRLQDASAFHGERQFASEPDYAPRSPYSPKSSFDDEPDLDESSTGGHVGRRKLHFDWQLALGVVLALGGVAMIVYLVVVLIVPHA